MVSLKQTQSNLKLCWTVCLFIGSYKSKWTVSYSSYSTSYHTFLKRQPKNCYKTLFRIKQSSNNSSFCTFRNYQVATIQLGNSIRGRGPTKMTLFALRSKIDSVRFNTVRLSNIDRYQRACDVTVSYLCRRWDLIAIDIATYLWHNKYRTTLSIHMQIQ